MFRCLLVWCLLALGGLDAAAKGRGDAPPKEDTGSDTLAALLGPQGYAALPLRRRSGSHLEVVARVNGVRGLFLVDTGAQITVMHRDSLKRFHLTPVRTGVRVYGAVGGPGERIDAALASSLQIGESEVTPFLVGVSDLSALNQGRRTKVDGRFDGIIGADVLQAFSSVVDCDGLRLYGKRTEPVPRPPSDLLSPTAGALGGFLRGRGYSEVPMRRFSISDFEVQSNVNGRRALWLVDTGAAITLLDTALSRQAGIRLNRTNLSVGGAGGGRQRIAIGVVDNLRLNGLRVRSAVIAVSDISANNAALQEDGKPPIDGYLGADFLRQRGAVIDCAQMRLYLKN